MRLKERGGSFVVQLGAKGLITGRNPARDDGRGTRGKPGECIQETVRKSRTGGKNVF